MALKIRLRSQGRRNHTVYRLVLTDVRSPRDGKYIELLGSYDPYVEENGVKVNQERTLYWLKQGAALTERAASLVKRAAPNLLVEIGKERDAVRQRRCAKRRAARKKREAAVV